MESTGFDKNYLLYNIIDSSKKTSYAASFGVDSISEALVEEYADCLKKFNRISVREYSGAKIVKDLTGKVASIVLDPTFLLTKDEWSELVAKRHIEYEYVLIYQLAYSEKLIAFAKYLAQKHCLKIVTINGNPRQIVRGRYIMTAGPTDWVGLFLNAKYIVTNSFHGVAFSLNFNKDFYVELLSDKFGVNTRITNILEIFSMENRIIRSPIYDMTDNSIDYNAANEKLEQLRDDSYAYLKDILMS